MKLSYINYINDFYCELSVIVTSELACAVVELLLFPWDLLLVSVVSVVPLAVAFSLLPCDVDDGPGAGGGDDICGNCTMSTKGRNSPQCFMNNKGSPQINWMSNTYVLVGDGLGPCCLILYKWYSTFKAVDDTYVYIYRARETYYMHIYATA